MIFLYTKRKVDNLFIITYGNVLDKGSGLIHR
jgi:hypothetical protein